MDSPPPSPTTNPSRRTGFLGPVIAVSLLIGGLAGGAVGGLIARGGVAGIIGGSANSSTSLARTGTLTVQEDSATVEVVKKVSPAVVSVVAKKDYGKVFGNQDQGSPFNLFPFFQQQTLPQGKQEIGGGTGFIVSSDGLILTNKHVAQLAVGADEFTVVTNDGKSYDAKVLATDPVTDIAVMKIDAKGLPTVELGNSDSLQIGDTVLAIGNVLGQYRNSVTKGIISGLGRTIRASDGSGSSETLRNVIQTDAAINHGNSGGPLLNLAGQAIGMNTAIDDQGQLVGFALPINLARRDLESVQQTGKIERPYLGVRYVPITPALQQENGLAVDYGALVSRGQQANAVAVVPGSPADKAGIVENDIILELDGTRVDANNDLGQLLNEHEVGQKVRIKLLSKGKEKTVEVTLETRPSS